MAQPFSVPQTAGHRRGRRTLAGDVFPLSPTTGASTSAARRDPDVRRPGARFAAGLVQPVRRAAADDQGAAESLQPEPLAGPALPAAGKRHRRLADRPRARRGHAHRRRQLAADLAGRHADRLHLRPPRGRLRPLRGVHGRTRRGPAVPADAGEQDRQRLVARRPLSRLRQHRTRRRASTCGWRRRPVAAPPVPLLTTPFNEFQAQISPDGRWIAYASDESGRWEVYVQSFPVLGAKRAISSGGGSEPQWRRDGRELFYVTADGTLMAVDVDVGSDAAGHAAHAALPHADPALGRDELPAQSLRGLTGRPALPRQRGERGAGIDHRAGELDVAPARRAPVARFAFWPGS